MNNTILDNTSLFALLYRWRKKIIMISFVAAVIAAFVSLLIPNKYESEVILFPAKHISTGHALFYEHGDFMEMGEDEELEHMMQILRSSDMVERVISKFDLLSHYKIDTSKDKYMFDLYKKYESNVKSEITQYSSISISVMDENPEMAANMANEIASLIDTVMNNMQEYRAMQAYKSLIKDREVVSNEIKVLEDSIAKIRVLGINDYESQAEVLNEQWAVAKIENNSEAVNAIEKKLKILSKYGGNYLSLRDDLLHAHSRLSIVDKRLNEHKITAQEQLTHIYILNHAGPALKKSYPIRWLIVVATAFSTAFFMVFVIALKEQIKRIKQS